MMKRLFFGVMIFWSVSSLSGQAGTAFMLNNWLFGPQIGYGLSSGNRADFKENMYKKMPGSSAYFGFSVYKFVSSQQSIGVSLNYLQQRWNFSEQQNSVALAPDAHYSVSEYSLLAPLEFNNYFEPGRQRWFLGVSIDPGFVLQKNLERKRNNDIDSTLIYEYSERGDFAKMNIGCSAKLGFDVDMYADNTLRFYFQFSARSFLRNSDKRSSTTGYFLTAQYFWSQ